MLCGHGDVLEPVLLRQVLGHHVHRQHLHPGDPQQEGALDEGVQGHGHKGQEHHGVVRGLQASPGLQREGGDSQLRGDQGQC